MLDLIKEAIDKSCNYDRHLRIKLVDESYLVLMNVFLYEKDGYYIIVGKNLCPIVLSKDSVNYLYEINNVLGNNYINNK